MSEESLHVIALVSGGKDSFFSALHCLEQGHVLVALANLCPPDQDGHGCEQLEEGVRVFHPGGVHAGDGCRESQDDLNSFMYQTVGHQVVPLYATATGLPVYQRGITGRAVCQGRDYDADDDALQSDETESMAHFLRVIISRHPEANALSAGAILSTYQRTRVESVAPRLGLVPLAYLWKYPVLPTSATSTPAAAAAASAPATATATAPVPTPPQRRKPQPSRADPAQLLHDMAAAHVTARIVKVASAGLDETFLWERVTSSAGARRVSRALSRFAGPGPLSASGGVLGEGGEFETLVTGGPDRLFAGKVVRVAEGGRKVVSGGSGCFWLDFAGEMAVVDGGTREEGTVRVPGLWDQRFEWVLEGLEGLCGGSEAIQKSPELGPTSSGIESESIEAISRPSSVVQLALIQPSSTPSIEEETTNLIALARQKISPSSITSVIIVLRHMSDFSRVNPIYATLFPKPNPPSRVTISCGDLLPARSNIAIYFTLDKGERSGLHVQSRSYWAPANIGPYSQAIQTPLFPEEHGSGGKLVTIAGQIPLVPATMALPGEDAKTQITLALQHLWRIGAEMKVQWWPSAVAYFPRQPGIREKALLAARAWKDAHIWNIPSDESESEDEGPDLWDRTFNPGLALDTDRTEVLDDALPDWDVFSGDGGISPVFAVEVEGLPRGSGVEWHAQPGVAGVCSPKGGIKTFSCRGAGWEYYVLRVCDGGAVFEHEVVALLAEGGTGGDAEALVGRCVDVRGEARGGRDGRRPYLVYVAGKLGEGLEGEVAVPCWSIWGGRGEGVAAVALWR